MRAIEISACGTPVAAHIRFTDSRPRPTPGPGEVLVKTEASAMNFLDIWVGRGLPGIETQWPMVSGSDGAGVVSEVGAGVDPAWMGKRVVLNAAIFAQQEGHMGRRPAGELISMIGEHHPGCHAEFFVAPATNLLDIGDSDPVSAAAFALSHLTAWRMLTTRARVQPGQSVLIPGIGGGVALAALGLARALSCTVIVTSRHHSKLERAMKLGAAHAVHDDGRDWSKDVRAFTGKRGVDVCIDSVGKAIHGQCLRSLARGGVFVTCGATSGGDPPTDLTRIFWNQLSILGSTMGTMDEFRSVMSLFRAGVLKPVVDMVMKPRDGAKGYARMEAGEQFGKLVFDWRE